MAIVPNWAEPLKDSLKKLISQPELSYQEIEQLRGTVALLKGTHVSDELERSLERQYDAIEKRYVEAAEKAASNKMDVVRAGIEVLEKLEGYKECEQKLAAARQHLDQLNREAEARAARRKKNLRLAAIAAALAVVAVIAGLVVHSQGVRRAVEERAQAARTQAEAGDYAAAVETLTTLVNEGRTGERYPAIYEATEAVLESAAEHEGFVAAYELYDDIRTNMPDGIQGTTFLAYADNRLEDDTLSVADRWQLLSLMGDRGYSLGNSGEAIAAAYLPTVSDDEAAEVATEAVEKGMIKADGDAFKAAFTRGLGAMSAEDAWDATMDALKKGVIKADGDAMADAVEKLAETLPAGDVWARVMDAVSSGVIKASDPCVERALDAVVAQADPESAWEAAQQAVSIEAVKSSYDKVKEAFVNYVNSMSIQEAWPIIYEAKRDKVYDASRDSLAHAYQKYLGVVSMEQAWSELGDYIKDGMISVMPADGMSKVVGARLDGISARLESGEAVDMPAEMEELQPVINRIAADPDSALRLAYALDGAGYDAAELFTGGIPIYIPVAERVQALKQDLINSRKSEQKPNMTVVLPVAVIEKDVYMGKEIYNISSMSETALDVSVKGRQDNNAAYEVRLLTEYLNRLPEDARPAAYGDCTALLCMQNSYLYAGNIYHFSTGGSAVYSFLNSNTYRPYYTALDMVTIYDLAATDVGRCLSLKQSHAQVEDQTWFNQNKSKDLFYKQYMLGEFDNEALAEAYGEVVDNFAINRLIIMLEDSIQEEENTDEADG